MKEEAPAEVADVVQRLRTYRVIMTLGGNFTSARDAMDDAAALITRLSADLAERDRVIGEAFETLTRIHQCADEELVRQVAKEAADKIEAPQQGDQS